MDGRPAPGADARRGGLFRARRGRRGQLALSEPLLAQVRAASDAAELARAMVRKEVSTAEARRRIAEFEQQGDRMRAAVVARLSKALITPLDREDLFRVSRLVDDVLDALREFVREADLYEIENRRSFSPMLDCVVRAVAHLDVAVHGLWERPGEVPSLALSAKKEANQIARAYQVQFARILEGPVTTGSLKRRELLRRLDTVGAHIHEAADALTEGVLKRGY